MPKHLTYVNKDGVPFTNRRHSIKVKHEIDLTVQ